MLPTLFTIPHEIAGIPFFGVGWALIIWSIFGLAVLVRNVRRHGWAGPTLEWLIMLAVVGVALGVVFPFLETEDPLEDGKKLGLSIRAYGMMMLLGLLTGVGLAVQRGRRMGYHPDLILSLALWIFVCGIIGARLFYVIQYRERFGGWLDFFKFTEGGLVVYGSVIGALGAATVFVYRHKLKGLQIADIIAPAMIAGLTLGRLGCLFNGCCWGGVCDAPLPSIRFPAGSGPYMQQFEETGLLLGWKLESGEAEWQRVASIKSDSLLYKKGIRKGDLVQAIYMDGDELRARRRQIARGDYATDELYPALKVKRQGERFTIVLVDEMPAKSLPVHPAQIYASANALIIFLFLYAYFPYRKRDGEIFALMMTLYPITRTLLELIRNDESGQFGTSLTVSQWVSVAMLISMVGLWLYILRQPKRTPAPA